MEKKKIWLDTDIGDDVDDAIALALVLSREDAELIGISTVYHQADLRARLAKKIVGLYHKSVPVYKGFDAPIGRSCGETPFTQHDELGGDMYAPYNQKPDEAIEALIAAAEQYGESLTVAGIGPYTNLAKAFQIAPQIMRKVQIVLMGGSFTEVYKEWNIVCDLKASDIVFGSGATIHCIGFDQTRFSRISQEDHDRLFSATLNEPADYVRRLIQKWETATASRAMMHDPFALYWIFRPELYEMRQGIFYLETQGEISEGMFFTEDQINPYVSKNRKEGLSLFYCARMAHEKVLKEILDLIFYNGNQEEK